MKILISRISPDTIGGAELSAFDQAVVLQELGHDVVLATNLKYLKKRAKELGIRTVWFPWINRGPLSFPRLRYLMFFALLPITFPLALVLVLRIKPDIINPHSREDQNAFTLTRWLHKTPVIWKDAGDFRLHFVNMSKGGFVRNLYLKIQLAAIRRADHIYCLNPDDTDNLIKFVGKEIASRCSSVPASILFRYYDRRAKPHKNKPKGKLVIGSLGRAEENRGLQFVIQAIKDMGCTDQVEFWQVGEGGLLYDQLKELSKDLPCHKIMPYTTNVSSYLNSFDILVHPVTEEGWGRIIKEAMYFGLPVVGSDVGGVKLQIENNKTGLLVKPGDVGELKKALNRLINDPSLRKQLGSAARAKAEADGDFVRIVKEQIVPIYESFV